MRWMLALGFTLAVSATSVVHAGYIDGSGRDWLDPDATRNLSWNDLSTVCSAATGTCSGTLALRDGGRTVDLTGYTWATREEVRDLFYQAGGLPAGSLDSWSAEFPASPEFALQFFANYDYTLSNGAFALLSGFTRSKEGEDLAYMGHVFGDDPLGGSPDYPASTFTFLTPGLDVWDPSFAAFVYRPISSVPEPAALALFAGAFGWLAYRRRRQTSAQP